MTLVASFIDSEGVLKEWVNSLSGPGGLVGEGNPLALGAHLRRLRSPFRGAYALLSVVGTPVPLVEERATAQARISASIYGVTKENAGRAAVAYANALTTVPVLKPVALGAQIHTVDAITGPVYLGDIDEERYLVDADVYFTASASVGFQVGAGVVSEVVLVQNTPAATWTFSHNLGRLPVVVVYVDGEEWGADVTATPTAVTVTFASPQSGTVVLT